VYSAGDIFYFVEDPENAVYDLDARVPDDALNFRDYNDTPFGDNMYYQFDSEDGSDFYCHFIYSDMGFRIKAYALDYKLRYPDGKTVFYGSRFDADESYLAKDSFDRKVGPNRVWGDNSRHRMHIESGPLKLDVTLKTLVPFFAPGEGGMMYLDAERKKKSHITHFPLFSAEGTIDDGSKIMKIKGWGYGNRGWQEGWLITYLTKFHTGLRWQKDGLGFDMYDYITTDHLGNVWMPILMVYNNGKMIHVSQSYEKENLDYYYEPKTGSKIPTSYRIKSVRKDSTVEIEFIDVKLTDYNDPLIILSKFEKYLLSFITEAPLDIRFDGYVKMKVTTPEGTITKEGPAHGLALVAL
jgi:hypothetical protein